MHIFNRPASHLSDAPTLELDRVSVSYGRVAALIDVSFQLGPGDQVAVVGPNGAGKSTLFNVVAGIIRPDRGAVRIYGSWPSEHICVGYVPQRNRIDWRFPVSVADVVMMGRVRKIGLFRWPSTRDRVAVRDALAQVGLADLANRQIGELSGGQQQRVFLARALAQQAELLLLDEPLTGLDLPSRDAILTILAELHHQGVATLTATHDLNQAAEHFPRILLLNRRVVAFGPPQEALTAQALAAAYGNQMHILQTNNGHWVITDTCCGGGQPPVETVLGHAEAAWQPAAPVETPHG